MINNNQCRKTCLIFLGLASHNCDKQRVMNYSKQIIKTEKRKNNYDRKSVGGFEKFAEGGLF